MVFNGDANGNDIVTYMNELVQSDNNLWTVASKTRYANMVQHEIWHDIFESYNGWQFDSVAGSPVSSQNLIAAQNTYTLPVGSLTVVGVNYLDQNGTSCILNPITLEELQVRGITETNWLSVNGAPGYYRLVGNNIIVYPTPSLSITNGLKVYFDRDGVTFVPSDTTATPGFASVYHEYTAIGACAKYAIANRLPHANDLSALYQKGRMDIRSFYQKRFKEKSPQSIRTLLSISNYK